MPRPLPPLLTPIAHAALSLIASAALLGACNAISGLDQDYFVPDDSSVSSSGGGDTQKPPDGTINPQEDGDTTPTDGNKPDEGPPLDCPGIPNAVFCWDFDKANPLQGGWAEDKNGGGIVELKPGKTGQGLHARVNGNGGSTAKGALIRKIPTKNWTNGKTLTLKYNLQVTAAETDYAAFSVFEFGVPEFMGGTPTDHGLAFYGPANQCAAAAPCLDETEPSHRLDHPLDTGGSIALGALLNTWLAVEVSIQWTGNDFGGTVKVNGTTLDTRTTNAMPSSGTTPAQVDLRMGVFFAGASANPVDVVIDDIVVTFN